MNKQIFKVALVAASAAAQNYEYGNACATNTDDDCALVSGCNSCNWSWPEYDPAEWDSPDAKCRCEPADSNDNSSEVNDLWWCLCDKN